MFLMMLETYYQLFHLGCDVPSSNSCDKKHCSNGYQCTEHTKNVWVQKEIIREKIICKLFSSINVDVLFKKYI